MADPADGVYEIGGEAVRPGERRRLTLPVAMLHTHTPVDMSVEVIRGRRPGPSLFVTAAVHGDELNGIEIIRRLSSMAGLKRLRGTLVLVPVVNVFGVLNHSRYLPDRRDLNRSFPGSERGSLAARLAHLVASEIIGGSTHGIDLHTGAIHRSNLPQIRGAMDDERIRHMARAFGVPAILDSSPREGSLRAAAMAEGIPTVVYEAGEALRFDEMAIRVGVKGIINVMRSIGMLAARAGASKPRREPVIARSSTWIRAQAGGILRSTLQLGALVEPGDRLGTISDPLGDADVHVVAADKGVVIGISSLPLVNEGDALIHIARFAAPERVADAVEALERDTFDSGPREPA